MVRSLKAFLAEKGFIKIALAVLVVLVMGNSITNLLLLYNDENSKTDRAELHNYAIENRRLITALESAERMRREMLNCRGENQITLIIAAIEKRGLTESEIEGIRARWECSEYDRVQPGLER